MSSTIWTPSRLVSTVRRNIGDPTTQTVREVREIVGISTGVDNGQFQANSPPVISGSTIVFRGGRYRYVPISNYSDKVADKRQFWFDYSIGVAYVPSGCTPVPSGQQVKLSYSWQDEQEYFYSDDDIWLFSKDAIEAVDALGFKHNYVFSGGTYATSSITPNLVGIDGQIVMVQTALLILEKDQRSHLSSAVVIREADMSFDNTRGVTMRIKTISDLQDKLNEILKTLLTRKQISQVARIDVYSTKDFGLSGMGEHYESGEYSDPEDGIP